MTDMDFEEFRDEFPRSRVLQWELIIVLGLLWAGFVVCRWIFTSTGSWLWWVLLGCGAFSMFSIGYIRGRYVGTREERGRHGTQASGDQE